MEVQGLGIASMERWSPSTGVLLPVLGIIVAKLAPIANALEGALEGGRGTDDISMRTMHLHIGISVIHTYILYRYIFTLYIYIYIYIYIYTMTSSSLSLTQSPFPHLLRILGTRLFSKFN